MLETLSKYEYENRDKVVASNDTSDFIRRWADHSIKQSGGGRGVQ